MDERSRHLRKLIIQGLEGGNRGHVGSSMSLVEILRVLYDNFLKFDVKNPNWEHRDRLILSKGHGCLALYALLADKGFILEEELFTFCKAKSRLGGHPEYKKIPGVEASTGALGHGLPMGVGMAIASKIKKLDHKVVVIMGDGEINEGSVWEAAMSAAKHRLSNLIAIVDYNKLQSYGTTKEVLDLEPLVDKWKSFGFHVDEVDGHNIDLLSHKLNHFPYDMKPQVLICHTVKGKGISFAENKANWHHKSNFKPDEIENLYKSIL